MNDDFLQTREKLHEFLKPHSPFDRMLEIGFGENFYSEFFPVLSIDVIDLSGIRKSKFPPFMKQTTKPENRYDVVMATGLTDTNYDHSMFYKWVMQSSCRIILISGSMDWAEKYRNYKYGKILHREKTMTHQITLYEYVGDNPTE